MQTLPHYLRPGLRLVIIGYNPSLYSAQAGHYYARPGNVFWRQLSMSGLAPRSVGPEDDALLMDEAGIGFIDLCARPTMRASELTREEIVAGATRLLSELLQYQPRVALFNGLGAYRWFATYGLGRAGAPYSGPPGELPARLGDTTLWVVPNSSGLASRWHRQRLDILRNLAGYLDDMHMQEDS